MSTSLAVSSPTSTKARVAWVDVGKALAIAIVFYYHIIEQLIYRHVPYTIPQGRYLASFTIPFFFFISGFVANDPHPDFKTHLRRIFKTLIIPLFFFNAVAFLLLIFARLFYDGPLIREVNYPLWVRIAALITSGLPVFNGPTWFLTCLFSTSLIYYCTRRCTKSTTGLLISTVILSLVGYGIAPLLNDPSTLVKCIKYFWYFPSAITAAAFYQAGAWSRKTVLFERLDTANKKWIAVLVGGAITAMAFNLDTNAFKGYFQIYCINHLHYGNYFLFYLCAFSGFLMLVGFSMLIKPSPLIRYYGENTLALLGLNGIMCHFINPALAQNLVSIREKLPWPIFVILFLLLAIVELAACYPLLAPTKKVLRFVADPGNYLRTRRAKASLPEKKRESLLDITNEHLPKDPGIHP